MLRESASERTTIACMSYIHVSRGRALLESKCCQTKIHQLKSLTLHSFRASLKFSGCHQNGALTRYGNCTPQDQGSIIFTRTLTICIHIYSGKKKPPLSRSKLPLTFFLGDYYIFYFGIYRRRHKLVLNAYSNEKLLSIMSGSTLTLVFASLTE